MARAFNFTSTLKWMNAHRENQLPLYWKWNAFVCYVCVCVCIRLRFDSAIQCSSCNNFHYPIIIKCLNLFRWFDFKIHNEHRTHSYSFWYMLSSSRRFISFSIRGDKRRFGIYIWVNLHSTFLYNSNYIDFYRSHALRIFFFSLEFA